MSAIPRFKKKYLQQTQVHFNALKQFFFKFNQHDDSRIFKHLKINIYDFWIKTNIEKIK